MPDTRAKRAPAMTDADRWILGQSMGLTEDGGWVNALKAIWVQATPEIQQAWVALLEHCRDARPRSGKTWLDAESESESKCGYPPLDIAGEEPKPDPGTVDYQSALGAAAPEESWFARFDAARLPTGFQADLARIVSRATQSGIGTLNRNTPNKDILRGMIWCAAVVGDPGCIDALRRLATWSIEHKTAQAKTIGIALAFLGSELSAAALRMIGQAAKRPSPKTRFDRYASHVESKIGLSREESSERFIPTFDLDSNRIRRIDCGKDGVIQICIKNSEAVIQWINGSAKMVKTPSIAMKRNHADLIANVRNSAKAIDKLLATQRSRLEFLLFEERDWSFNVWQERYLNHPVVGALASRLIWIVDGRAAVFPVGLANDVLGNNIDVESQARVRLWHPIARGADEVREWRNRLELLGLTQPFKQAHREIYLLTDAERQTHSYSNRFAAHILNQSQFRALASARQWERPFIGGWDSGDNVARRMLPGNWRVELWLEGAGNEHGPTGALLHVVTDQIRFYRGGQTDPAPLEQVPPLIFSEAMRDADLFVGVASVGNDPTWNDGGPEGRHRDYWYNYSFGDLNASAKTRKEVLQRLIPRLRISTVCTFEEKFLVVSGQLRTYRIHLGSGNILMKPNDQYLCIVPKQGEQSDDVLLPFEGDRTLSVILSKAFLLAADTKIKDETITQQITQK